MTCPLADILLTRNLALSLSARDLKIAKIVTLLVELRVGWDQLIPRK